MHQISSQWSNVLCKTDLSIKPSAYPAIQLSINLKTIGVNYTLLLVFRYEIKVIGLAISIFQKEKKQLHITKYNIHHSKKCVARDKSTPTTHFLHACKV